MHPPPKSATGDFGPLKAQRLTGKLFSIIEELGNFCNRKSRASSFKLRFAHKLFGLHFKISVAIKRPNLFQKLQIQGEKLPIEGLGANGNLVKY